MKMFHTFFCFISIHKSVLIKILEKNQLLSALEKSV